MSVSGPAAGGGALVRWNAVHRVAAVARNAGSHARGSHAGRDDAAPDPGGSAQQAADAPAGHETHHGVPPALPRRPGDPRALTAFFAHGLEPARVGTLVDTYA